MNDQDRGIWPSASGFWHLCPGSHAAQLGLPDVAREDADHGTRVHRYCSMKVEDLDPQETNSDVIRDGDALLAKLEEAKRSLGFEGVPQALNEDRLWIHFDDYARSSGQLDAAYINTIDRERVALVVDYKSGWGEQDPGTINMQLRRQAVLLWGNYNIDRVFVKLVTLHGDSDPADYNINDILDSSKEYANQVRCAMSIAAPRIPGDHCKLCKAAGTCKEAIEFAAGHTAIAKPGDSKGQAIYAVKRMSDEDLGKVATNIVAAESILKACRDEIKLRLKQGKKIGEARL